MVNQTTLALPTTPKRGMRMQPVARETHHPPARPARGNHYPPHCHNCPTVGRPSAGGFTLIELLVALLVFAIMSAMAYGGLEAVMRTRTEVHDAEQRTRTLQLAMFRLQTDIDQLRNRPVRDSMGDTRPSLMFDDATDRLIFTRGGWANPLQERRSTLQRVAYGFEDGDLVRYAWRELDRAPDNHPARVVLARHIKSLTWRFLGQDHQWHDSLQTRDQSLSPVTPGGADKAQPASRPLAVEVNLNTKDWGQLRYVLALPH